MIEVGDGVEVYRNMPLLAEYPESVEKGVRGTVDWIFTNAPPEVGKWALIVDSRGESYCVKFSYLKKVK